MGRGVAFVCRSIYDKYGGCNALSLLRLRFESTDITDLLNKVSVSDRNYLHMPDIHLIRVVA